MKSRVRKTSHQMGRRFVASLTVAQLLLMAGCDDNRHALAVRPQQALPGTYQSPFTDNRGDRQISSRYTDSFSRRQQEEQALIDQERQARIRRAEQATKDEAKVTEKAEKDFGADQVSDKWPFVKEKVLVQEEKALFVDLKDCGKPGLDDDGDCIPNAKDPAPCIPGGGIELTLELDKDDDMANKLVLDAENQKTPMTGKELVDGVRELYTNVVTATRENLNDKDGKTRKRYQGARLLPMADGKFKRTFGKVNLADKIDDQRYSLKDVVALVRGGTNHIGGGGAEWGAEANNEKQYITVTQFVLTPAYSTSAFGAFVEAGGMAFVMDDLLRVNEVAPSSMEKYVPFGRLFKKWFDSDEVKQANAAGSVDEAKIGIGIFWSKGGKLKSKLLVNVDATGAEIANGEVISDGDGEGYRPIQPDRLCAVPDFINEDSLCYIDREDWNERAIFMRSIGDDVETAKTLRADVGDLRKMLAMAQAELTTEKAKSEAERNLAVIADNESKIAAIAADLKVKDEQLANTLGLYSRVDSCLSAQAGTSDEQKKNDAPVTTDPTGTDTTTPGTGTPGTGTPGTGTPGTGAPGTGTPGTGTPGTGAPGTGTPGTDNNGGVVTPGTGTVDNTPDTGVNTTPEKPATTDNSNEQLADNKPSIPDVITTQNVGEALNGLTAAYDRYQRIWTQKERDIITSRPGHWLPERYTIENSREFLRHLRDFNTMIDQVTAVATINAERQENVAHTKINTIANDVHDQLKSVVVELTKLLPTNAMITGTNGIDASVKELEAGVDMSTPLNDPAILTAAESTLAQVTLEQLTNLLSDAVAYRDQLQNWRISPDELDLAIGKRSSDGKLIGDDKGDIAVAIELIEKINQLHGMKTTLFAEAIDNIRIGTFDYELGIDTTQPDATRAAQRRPAVHSRFKEGSSAGVEPSIDNLYDAALVSLLDVTNVKGNRIMQEGRMLKISQRIDAIKQKASK